MTTSKLQSLPGVPVPKLGNKREADLRKSLSDGFRWITDVMFPRPLGTYGVWERVRINPDVIQYWVRADCTAEAAWAFFQRHRLGGAPSDLEITRNLLRFLQSLQLPYGAFPFYRFMPPAEEVTDGTAGGHGIWPNDNGKVLEILVRLAREPVLADLRLDENALRLAAYFQETMRPEGWWRFDGTDYPGACFVAWPVTAFSRLWEMTGKEEHRAVALSAARCLKSLQRPSGRLTTSYETNRVENWRPPSSETAEALKAFSVAQSCLGEDFDGEIARCATYLEGLSTEEGAVRNADLDSAAASEQTDPALADLVYTQSYALAGWIEAARTTGRESHMGRAVDLACFLARIQCRNESPLWDGSWRGSWDVEKGEWRGTADQSNPLDEGGMYSAYTGWTALPILASMAELLAAGGEAL